MVLSPRESGGFIVRNADHVKINENGIDKLKSEIIQHLKDGTLSVNNFSQVAHHPSSNDENAPNWIFLVDSLNFCFWTPGDSDKWKVNGFTGYYGLCAAINRVIKEDGINITDPKFYKNIDREQLLHIFRSDDGKTMIPLIDERVKCLHEVGTKLLEKFNGDFRNCIQIANQSAKELLKLIVTEFPCYRDEAVYKNENVAFYKRAQILIGDIWACYRGEGLGRFQDIDNEITMFADYRVPQVLIHFGALEYSKELMNILREDKLLQNGDSVEVEIRGASIYIVEKLKEKIKNEINELHPDIDETKVNSILIDHFLWDYRRRFSKELEHIPFHKVLSIYY